MNRRTLLYTASAIADAHAVIPGGAILVECSSGAARTLAAGRSDEVRRHPLAPGSLAIDRPGSLFIPGLVNAHAHLDLTHVGPRPEARARPFREFINIVRSGRCDERGASASVARGAELSDAGATAAIGDIAGSGPTGPTLAPWRTLCDRREFGELRGVSFVEYFGIGSPAGVEAAEALVEASPASTALRIGLSPHAPYTVGAAGFARARSLRERRGVPIATHLAETPEERRLIADADGPFRELLEEIGVWGPACEAEFGHGLSPVEHWARRLGGGPVLVVHVNDASDSDLLLLAREGASVAYCPRASEFFGAGEHFGPHRYRAMLDAGINVCLGTDSIINLPAEAARTEHGISILDEMRLLRARDGTDARLLLALGTTHGARALGMDPSSFAFTPGAELAGLVEVPIGGASKDPLAAALETTTRPRLLLRWVESGEPSR